MKRLSIRWRRLAGYVSVFGVATLSALWVVSLRWQVLWLTETCAFQLYPGCLILPLERAESAYPAPGFYLSDKAEFIAQLLWPEVFIAFDERKLCLPFWFMIMGIMVAWLPALFLHRLRQKRQLLAQDLEDSAR